jgi:hypothetical protein
MVFWPTQMFQISKKGRGIIHISYKATKYSVGLLIFSTSFVVAKGNYDVFGQWFPKFHITASPHLNTDFIAALPNFTCGQNIAFRVFVLFLNQHILGFHQLIILIKILQLHEIKQSISNILRIIVNSVLPCNFDRCDPF